MLALQFNLPVPWNMVLDALILFLVWGTVVSGLILVVRDCMEADPFHQRNPHDTQAPPPAGICVVEHRLCAGCGTRTDPPASDPVLDQDV